MQASRSMRGGWTLGLSHRYFGFEKDLDESYFDPDYFGLTELVARGLWEAGRWGIVLEFSPGAQKVRSEGEYRGALRSSARIAYRVAPGREVLPIRRILLGGTSELQHGGPGLPIPGLDPWGQLGFLAGQLIPGQIQDAVQNIRGLG